MCYIDNSCDLVERNGEPVVRASDQESEEKRIYFPALPQTWINQLILVLVGVTGLPQSTRVLLGNLFLKQGKKFIRVMRAILVCTTDRSVTSVY